MPSQTQGIEYGAADQHFEGADAVGQHADENTQDAQDRF